LVHAEAVIPPRSQSKTPRYYDQELYTERNLIERMFNKLKHFRRVTTRYDKRDNRIPCLRFSCWNLSMVEINVDTT
jgi:transposase